MAQQNRDARAASAMPGFHQDRVRLSVREAVPKSSNLVPGDFSGHNTGGGLARRSPPTDSKPQMMNSTAERLSDR